VRRVGSFTRVWFALAALGAGSAMAREPEGTRLRAWDLPGYTLFAEDGFDAADVVRNMAQADLVLRKLLPRAAPAVTTPLQVWLVPRPLWNRHLAPGNGIEGEFVPRRFSNYLIINGDLPSGFENDGLKHEYTHWFLRTQVGGIHPLWFDEGLAVLIGNADIRGSRVTFKPVPGPRVGGWVQMSRLFELDKSSREYLENPQTQFVHFESHALVYRGLIGEPQFGTRIFAYLSAINRLMPPQEAAARSFGMSFDELDRDMRAYMMRKDVTVGTLRIEPPAVAKLPAGRRLEPAEAALRLARVALDTGFRPERAGELVTTAQSLAPDAPEIAVLKLRLAVRDRDDREMLRLAATFDAVNDAAALRGAGVALFERVREPDRSIPAETRERYERLAFGLLDRALRAGPAEAEAAWAFGLLAARLGSSVSPALERLAGARERLPGNPDLAEATARALEASDQEDAMMPFLLDSLRNTNSADQRLWAAQRIRELQRKARESAPQ
jgi:hypothetical protein